MKPSPDIKMGKHIRVVDRATASTLPSTLLSKMTTICGAQAQAADDDDDGSVSTLINKQLRVLSGEATWPWRGILIQIIILIFQILSHFADQEMPLCKSAVAQTSGEVH